MEDYELKKMLGCRSICLTKVTINKWTLLQSGEVTTCRRVMRRRDRYMATVGPNQYYRITQKKRIILIADIYY